MKIVVGTLMSLVYRYLARANSVARVRAIILTSEKKRSMRSKLATLYNNCIFIK